MSHDDKRLLQDIRLRLSAVDTEIAVRALGNRLLNRLDEAVAAPSHVEAPGPDFNTESNLHADTVAERYDSARSSTRLTDWLREHAPDCGDNSCLFGGRGKGGMRTNGGCRCFKDVRPEMKRIFIERMWAALSAS